MKTKEKILDKALELFAKQGIENTSTSQITKACGIASGTLFVYFKTKQELIDTLYISIKKKSFAEVSEGIDQAGSAKESAMMWAKRVIEYFISHYSEFKFIELVETAPIVSEPSKQAGMEQYKALFVLIEKWQKEGHFKELDLDMIITVIWSVSIAMIRYYILKGEKNIDEKHLEILWDTLKK